MKRYFLAPSHSLDPQKIGGEYHYVDLGSHGPQGAGYCIVTLVADHAEPLESWRALPHLLDANNKLPAAVVALLGDLAITATDTTLSVAQKLAAIHPKFRP